MKVEGYDLDEMPVVEATNVGSVSLVGIGGDGKFPLDWGNYFSLETADGKTYEIANMWYENLKHLIDDHKILFPIDIKIIETQPHSHKDGWAIVYDDRVPRNFYTDISYRAPKKFWSLTEQANRQLDIDSGKLKITTLENGMTVESRWVESKSRPLRKGLVFAPYVPMYVNADSDESVEFKETIVDPKYYGFIDLTDGGADEEDTED